VLRVQRLTPALRAVEDATMRYLVFVAVLTVGCSSSPKERAQPVALAVNDGASPGEVKVCDEVYCVVDPNHHCCEKLKKAKKATTTLQPSSAQPQRSKVELPSRITELSDEELIALAKQKTTEAISLYNRYIEVHVNAGGDCATAAVGLAALRPPHKEFALLKAEASKRPHLSDRLNNVMPSADKTREGVENHEHERIAWAMTSKCKRHEAYNVAESEYRNVPVVLMTNCKDTKDPLCGL